MTACAPLCGLAGVAGVTSRPSPQTPPWQKRVACVRHPANSAQPKVAGEPGGRKMCRIKAGGRFGAPPASHTAPQSGSGLFHRWSEFSLFAGTGGRKSKSQRGNCLVSAFRKVAVTGGFQRFCGDQRGGHFSSPGVKPGVCFSSALTAAVFSAGPGGDILKYCATKQRIKVLKKVVAIPAEVWYVLVLQRRQWT